MRAVILILVGTAVLAVLCVWGAIAWWKSNSAGLLDGMKTTYAEGQKAGASLNENGCLDRALERGKQQANRSIGEAMKTQIGLTACLNESKVNPEFCKSVPSLENPFSAGMWTAKICKQMGSDDPHCGGLMQEVAKYCASPKRKAKLNALENAKPG